MKRNAFKPALKRWMNLEPIIQNEVSQKEKNKYCILTHKYGIQRDGTDEPIPRAAVETQTQRRLMHEGGGEKREGEMNGESSMEVYTLTYVNRQPTQVYIHTHIYYKHSLVQDLVVRFIFITEYYALLENIRYTYIFLYWKMSQLQC